MVRLNIYRFLRNNFFELLFAIAILIVSFAIVSELLILSHPRSSSHRTWSGTLVWHVVPYIEMQVSPPGYPLVGELWTINVYVVNKTLSDKVTHNPAPNATVHVTLLSEGIQKTYVLSTNVNGEATFEYYPNYTDIAFEAQIPGLSPSQKIVLSTHYVSSDVVDSLLTLNLVSIVAWLSGGYLISKKIGFSTKWVKLEKWTLSLMVFVFAFSFLFAVYSKFFQETIWGHPHNVVNGLITLSLLRDVIWIWLVIYVSYSTVKFIVWVRAH